MRNGVSCLAGFIMYSVHVMYWGEWDSTSGVNIFKYSPMTNL